MKILTSVFFIFFLNLNFYKSDDIDASTAELNKDLEEISMIKRRSKLVACMSLVRNSLSEGNEEVKSALAKSSYDKSKSFDKILVTILNNCEKNIKDSEMEKTLTPENILTPISSNANLAKLIKFDKNILSQKEGITFSEEESNILKEINDSSQTIDTDVTMQDEEIGLMGFKLSKMGNSGYLFIIIALVLVFVVIFGGLYQLKCKKKEGKVKLKKK